MLGSYTTGRRQRSDLRASSLHEHHVSPNAVHLTELFVDSDGAEAGLSRLYRQFESCRGYQRKEARVAGSVAFHVADRFEPNPGRGEPAFPIRGRCFTTAGCRAFLACLAGVWRVGSRLQLSKTQLCSGGSSPVVRGRNMGFHEHAKWYSCTFVLRRTRRIECGSP